MFPTVAISKGTLYGMGTDFLSQCKIVPHLRLTIKRCHKKGVSRIETSNEE